MNPYQRISTLHNPLQSIQQMQTIQQPQTQQQQLAQQSQFKNQIFMKSTSMQSQSSSSTISVVAGMPVDPDEIIRNSQYAAPRSKQLPPRQYTVREVTDDLLSEGSLISYDRHHTSQQQQQQLPTQNQLQKHSPSLSDFNVSYPQSPTYPQSKQHRITSLSSKGILPTSKSSLPSETALDNLAEINNEDVEDLQQGIFSKEIKQQQLSQIPSSSLIPPALQAQLTDFEMDLKVGLIQRALSKLTNIFSKPDLPDSCTTRCIQLLQFTAADLIDHKELSSASRILTQCEAITQSLPHLHAFTTALLGIFHLNSSSTSSSEKQPNNSTSKVVTKYFQTSVKLSQDQLQQSQLPLGLAYMYLAFQQQQQQHPNLNQRTRSLKEQCELLNMAMTCFQNIKNNKQYSVNINNFQLNFNNLKEPDFDIDQLNRIYATKSGVFCLWKLSICYEQMHLLDTALRTFETCLAEAEDAVQLQPRRQTTTKQELLLNGDNLCTRVHLEFEEFSKRYAQYKVASMLALEDTDRFNIPITSPNPPIIQIKTINRTKTKKQNLININSNKSSSAALSASATPSQTILTTTNYGIPVSPFFQSATGKPYLTSTTSASLLQSATSTPSSLKSPIRHRTAAHSHHNKESNKDSIRPNKHPHKRNPSSKTSLRSSSNSTFSLLRLSSRDGNRNTQGQQNDSDSQNSFMKQSTQLQQNHRSLLRPTSAALSSTTTTTNTAGNNSNTSPPIMSSSELFFSQQQQQIQQQLLLDSQEQNKSSNHFPSSRNPSIGSIPHIDSFTSFKSAKNSSKIAPSQHSNLSSASTSQIFSLLTKQQQQQQFNSLPISPQQQQLQQQLLQQASPPSSIQNYIPAYFSSETLQQQHQTQQNQAMSRIDLLQSLKQQYHRTQATMHDIELKIQNEISRKTGTASNSNYSNTSPITTILNHTASHLLMQSQQQPQQQQSQQNHRLIRSQQQQQPQQQQPARIFSQRRFSNESTTKSLKFLKRQAASFTSGSSSTSSSAISPALFGSSATGTPQKQVISLSATAKQQSLKQQNSSSKTTPVYTSTQSASSEYSSQVPSQNNGSKKLDSSVPVIPDQTAQQSHQQSQFEFEVLLKLESIKLRVYSTSASSPKNTKNQTLIKGSMLFLLNQNSKMLQIQFNSANLSTNTSNNITSEQTRPTSTGMTAFIHRVNISDILQPPANESSVRLLGAFCSEISKHIFVNKINKCLTIDFSSDSTSKQSAIANNNNNTNSQVPVWKAQWFTIKLKERDVDIVLKTVCDSILLLTEPLSTTTGYLQQQPSYFEFESAEIFSYNQIPIHDLTRQSKSHKQQLQLSPRDLEESDDAILPITPVLGQLLKISPDSNINNIQSPSPAQLLPTQISQTQSNSNQIENEIVNKQTLSSHNNNNSNSLINNNNNNIPAINTSNDSPNKRFQMSLRREVIFEVIEEADTFTQQNQYKDSNNNSHFNSQDINNTLLTPGMTSASSPIHTNSKVLRLLENNKDAQKNPEKGDNQPNKNPEIDSEYNNKNQTESSSQSKFGFTSQSTSDFLRKRRMNQQQPQKQNTNKSSQLSLLHVPASDHLGLSLNTKSTSEDVLSPVPIDKSHKQSRGVAEANHLDSNSKKSEKGQAEIMSTTVSNNAVLQQIENDFDIPNEDDRFSKNNEALRTFKNRFTFTGADTEDQQATGLITPRDGTLEDSVMNESLHTLVANTIESTETVQKQQQQKQIISKLNLNNQSEVSKGKSLSDTGIPNPNASSPPPRIFINKQIDESTESAQTPVYEDRKRVIGSAFDSLSSDPFSNYSVQVINPDNSKPASMLGPGSHQSNSMKGTVPLSAEEKEKILLEAEEEFQKLLLERDPQQLNFAAAFIQRRFKRKKEAQEKNEEDFKYEPSAQILGSSIRNNKKFVSAPIQSEEFFKLKQQEQQQYHRPMTMILEQMSSIEGGEHSISKQQEGTLSKDINLRDVKEEDEENGKDGGGKNKKETIKLEGDINEYTAIANRIGIAYKKKKKRNIRDEKKEQNKEQQTQHLTERDPIYISNGETTREKQFPEGDTSASGIGGMSSTLGGGNIAAAPNSALNPQATDELILKQVEVDSVGFDISSPIIDIQVNNNMNQIENYKENDVNNISKGEIIITNPILSENGNSVVVVDTLNPISIPVEHQQPQQIPPVVKKKASVQAKFKLNHRSNQQVEWII